MPSSLPPLCLFPGWTSSVTGWSPRRTTSSLPSQQSTPNVACSRIRCCSAVPAPVPNTSAFAPAETIVTGRWRCAETAYDQRRICGWRLFSNRRKESLRWNAVLHKLYSFTSEQGLAAKIVRWFYLSGNCMIVLWMWWVWSLSLKVYMAALGPQSLQRSQWNVSFDGSVRLVKKSWAIKRKALIKKRKNIANAWTSQVCLLRVVWIPTVS